MLNISAALEFDRAGSLGRKVSRGCHESYMRGAFGDLGCVSESVFFGICHES